MVVCWEKDKGNVNPYKGTEIGMLSIMKTQGCLLITTEGPSESDMRRQLICEEEDKIIKGPSGHTVTDTKFIIAALNLEDQQCVPFLSSDFASLVALHIGTSCGSMQMGQKTLQFPLPSSSDE